MNPPFSSVIQAATLLLILMGSLSGCRDSGGDPDSKHIDNMNVSKYFEGELFGSLVGTHYNTLTLNNQLWMAEDLRETSFRNGEPIPQARSASEWQQAVLNNAPAWCFLDFDKNNSEHGLYYNWYAVNDPRGLAPEGWEIPPNRMLFQMARELSFDSWHIKAADGWQNRHYIYNATGFSAYPGGLVSASGSFNGTDNSTYWWSATEKNAENAMYMMVYEDFSSIVFRDLPKEFGMLVRCYRPLNQFQDSKQE